MDQQNSESYEFLDLSDVNDSERKEIIKTLYQNNKKGQQSTTTRTTTATSTTTTTSQLQLQHHSVNSSNFHPQIVFFPPPQQHFYIHPQFESSFLQHQQQHHHHHQLQHIQLQHQPQLQDQQQSSTSASETTSVYRSSSVSNCSDSTSDCVTPSGSVLNLSEAATTAASNSSKNYSRSATVVRNISNIKSSSATSSATNINPPPPTYSAVVYGGVGSRGSGPTTSLTTTTSSSSSSSSKRQPHFNGNNDLKNPNFEDDFENNHLPNHQKPRHFKRYVKTTHVDHSTQNTKGKSSGSSNSKTSTNNLVGNSTTTLNMTQQQQQSQQNQQPQQSAPQPQNVSQSNNNNQPASNNGNTVAAVAANNSLNNFHPHGGYGTVPYTVHHGGHSIYPAVIPATLPPGNVYVNNVTANVNVGWTPGHPGVQAAYIPSSQSYITAGSAGHPVEVVGDQPPPVMQPVHMSLPVRNRTPHRGRGRGGPNGNNSRRSEYTPRQQQDSPNQASQSTQQRTGGGSGANSNNMPPSQQQQQTPHQPQHQPQQPPPQIESGTQATLSAYPYAYQYTYPAFYGHQGMMHSQTATAAQNVTGPPIYVAPYMGHPVYNYPFMYSPVMPQDYIYENNGETMFYAPIAETDINQNPAPGEAQILSPAGYPMYDPQMHEMHQQMNAVHLYDTQGTQPPPHLVGGPIVEIDQGAENIQIGGDQMTSPHDQESGIQVVPASAAGAPTVVPVPGGPVPQEGPYILAPVVPVDNQLNNSGSEDLDTLSLHSNEMMIPLEMTSQIQPVPMAVPFIQPMEPQHSPVQYEAVPEHAVAPTAIPKEVVAIVGRDFNQNQMPNVPMNIEPEIPIESISFQQNVIEEHKIEEVSVSIQQEPAVQIESKINMNSTSSATTTTVGVTNNHVEEAAATISNVADGTMVHTTITKSMSWTNQQHNHQPQSTTHHHQPQQHHYNKKSTASVAVTATPTPSNGKSFTPSTKQQTASTTTTPSPQVKNHGVMKTPSSPVGVQNSTTNNNNSSTKGTTTSSSTSTVSASATAVPQQLQESKKTTSKSQSNLVFTPPITTPTPQPPSNNTWASLFTPSPATTNFTTSSSAATPGAAASTQNNNSALPASSSTTNNSQTNANNATTTNSSSTATTNPVPMKPVAKVAPYESGAVSQQSSSSTAQPQNISNHTNNYSTIPGALSYSAASTQSLSSGVGGAQTANKKPQNSVASTVNKATSATTSTTTTSTNNKNRETSNACGDEWSFKLAKFLNKYKPDFNAVSLKPRGLMNKSNYCYINSILQALIGCPPFYNLLKNLPKQPTALQTEIKTPTLNAMVQLAAEFSTLPPGVRLNFNKREKVQKDGRTVKDDNNGGTDLQCDSAFEPSAIYKLWNLTRSDAEGRQEDAEEFLCFILNKLNDEMLEVIKLVNKPQAPKENGEADDDEDWQVIASNGKSSVFRQTDYGRTPLSDIFRGETRSRLQREGGMSKDAVQPFFTLQLNIEKAASVKEALDLLVGREQLEGFSCSKTNQEVVAWQQMLLEKLPVVLILHLKWFDYKGDGCSKILKNVEFPVELSLDNKIVSSKKNSKGRVYRLFAVVYHDGKEATKGHYITDVYHPGYLNWLRFDDSSVKPISEKTVLMPILPRVPYLLLYRRSDTFVAGQPEHHSTLAAHKKNNQKNNN